MFALLAFPFANSSVKSGYYLDMPPYSSLPGQSSDVTEEGYQLAKCGRLEPCGRIVKVIVFEQAESKPNLPWFRLRADTNEMIDLC